VGDLPHLLNIMMRLTPDGMVHSIMVRREMGNPVLDLDRLREVAVALEIILAPDHPVVVVVQAITLVLDPVLALVLFRDRSVIPLGMQNRFEW
jgi:hypothetical protein